MKDIKMQLPKVTLDDLFTTQEERDNKNMEKKIEIPIKEISDFPNHPYKVIDNEEMLELSRSIKENGDYYLPNIKLLAEKENQNLGKYGLIRLRFLKEHKRGLYTELLLENKLIEHLKSIDDIATKRIKQYIKEMIIQENINEQLKADNQLEWVRRMNNIKNSAEEVVFKELIYD